MFIYTDDEPAVFVQFYKDVLELGNMAKLGERSIHKFVRINFFSDACITVQSPLPTNFHIFTSQTFPAILRVPAL